MKTCSYCGLENEDSAVSCKECCTELIDTGAPPSASSAPPAVSRLEFVPFSPDEADNDFVTLTRCRTLLEADMIVGQLESAGITAFIPDQFLMQTISFNVNTYGFVRVQVPPQQYQAAKDLLLATETAG